MGKMKRGIYISFVEECIMNPKYLEYAAGRIEVYNESDEYACDEIRFFTKRRKEFMEFREKWDMRYISPEQLVEIEKTVKEQFYEKSIC